MNFGHLAGQGKLGEALKTKLPAQVVEFRTATEGDPAHPLFNIIQKLSDAGQVDLVRMWQTLEQHKVGEDDLWVYAFLTAVNDAHSPPKFHNLPAKERRELAADISSFGLKLTKALQANDLDAHFIYTDEGIFAGFHVYEDFDESNRSRIDKSKVPSFSFVDAIQHICTRSIAKLEFDPMPAKSGKNSDAIRFARRLSSWNLRMFGDPLLSVTSAATNAFFNTYYTDNCIYKLLIR